MPDDRRKAFRREVAAIAGDVKASLRETKNSHRSKLCADIDEIRDMVRQGFSDICADIGGIRRDICGLRGEHIDGDQRR